MTQRNTDLDDYIKHAIAKNALLTQFKKDSSSELSFLRRTATLALLDALCQMTGRDTCSLFGYPALDLHALVKKNIEHPLVITFMLCSGLDKSTEPSVDEGISFALMELSKYLTA